MFPRLVGALEPYLPRRALEPPSGAGWIHEIKHDGFRILARRQADRMRLYTRNGYDFTERYPKIVAALENLPVQSCFIDGEAIVVDERGLSVFDALRWRLRDHAAILCAFDLIELDGEDLRRQSLERRKATLADLLRGVRDGIAYNQHFASDGATIFQHACALGCEGIVSKWLGSQIAQGVSISGLRSRTRTFRPAVGSARKIGASIVGRAVGDIEMVQVSPFFGFVLALIIPGALVILLAALLRAGPALGGSRRPPRE